MAEGKTTVLVSGWTLLTYQVRTVIGWPDLKLMLMVSLYISLQPYSTVNLSINVLFSRTDTTPACETNLTTSAAAMPVHVRVRSYSLQFPSDIGGINSSQRVQLRLVQSDHRGGFCDCWTVSRIRISSAASDLGVSLDLK